jgi:hypothetical protein
VFSRQPGTGAFDVELVAAPGAAPQPAAKGFLRLTNRDWALLGLGAAAVILAVVVGLVVALFLKPA